MISLSSGTIRLHKRLRARSTFVKLDCSDYVLRQSTYSDHIPSGFCQNQLLDQ